MGQRILIVSASIGTGHTQAALAIQEYWQQKDPSAVVHHVDFLGTDTFSFDNLLKETYFKMLDFFPFLYDIVYRWSGAEWKGSVAQTVVSWMLKNRMEKLIEKEEPDLIVCTHPFPCGAASVLKRHRKIEIPIVAVMTDFAAHQFWRYDEIDAYHVATPSMVYEVLNMGVPLEKIHVTGIPIMRHFFTPLKEPYGSDSCKRVLLMGGGLGLGCVEEALQRLDHVPGIDEIHVVAGLNDGLYNSLHHMKESLRTPISIYGYTNEIPELMRKATLLVTKPGALTCMEGVTIGVPMVFFNAIPGQEEANAELLEQKGCGKWARHIENLDDVVGALLQNHERLQAMHEAAKAWKVDGAAEIVAACEDMLAHKQGMLE